MAAIQKLTEIMCIKLNIQLSTRSAYVSITNIRFPTTISFETCSHFSVGLFGVLNTVNQLFYFKRELNTSYIHEGKRVCARVMYSLGTSRVNARANQISGVSREGAPGA